MTKIFLQYIESYPCRLRAPYALYKKSVVDLIGVHPPHDNNHIMVETRKHVNVWVDRRKARSSGARSLPGLHKQTERVAGGLCVFRVGRFSILHSQAHVGSNANRWQRRVYRLCSFAPWSFVLQANRSSHIIFGSHLRVAKLSFVLPPQQTTYSTLSSCLLEITKVSS